MNNILFFGDLHLDNKTPFSRVDNYSDVTIKKLESLLELAIENNVNTVICTGDFFEAYDTTIIYLSKIISVFNKYKENGISIYTAIGNHELPHTNMKYFDNTPLGILIKSKVINRLDREPIIIGNAEVYGLHFSESFDDINVIPSALKKILVMHYAVDNTVPNESVSSKKLTNFDIVVSGHDHMYYKPKKQDDTLILRPGSFTRRTKDDYNLTRDIIVYLYSQDSGDIKELKLPGVEPAELVFKSSSFIDTKAGTFDKDLLALLYSDTATEGDTIAIILEEIKAIFPDKVINIIKDYYTTNYKKI